MYALFKQANVVRASGILYLIGETIDERLKNAMVVDQKWRDKNAAEC
jgi:hypothetical protein